MSPHNDWLDEKAARAAKAGHIYSARGEPAKVSTAAWVDGVDAAALAKAERRRAEKALVSAELARKAASGEARGLKRWALAVALATLAAHAWLWSLWAPLPELPDVGKHTGEAVTRALEGLGLGERIKPATGDGPEVTEDLKLRSDRVLRWNEATEAINWTCTGCDRETPTPCTACPPETLLRFSGPVRAWRWVPLASFADAPAIVVYWRESCAATCWQRLATCGCTGKTCKATSCCARWRLR